MKKVLIIEDDVWLAEHITRVVVKCGYETLQAGNAYSAMDVIDKEQPDILFVDMLLPGGTIMTLLHELQSYIDTRQIPVILCTNMTEYVSQEDMSSYGVRRMLDKATMQPSDIVAALKAVDA